MANFVLNSSIFWQDNKSKSGSRTLHEDFKILTNFCS